MKKEVVRSFRVDSDIDDILRTLAEKEDRPVAWIIRKLVIEALDARRLLKGKTRAAR
jgi:predicted transcriptional regulator